MIRVLLQGDSGDIGRVRRLGNGAQGAYYFSAKDGAGGADGVVPVQLREREGCSAVSFDRRGGVVVSTWQSAEIGAYVGVPQSQYVLMLGVLQWRSLMLNALLTPEDFLHERACGCLFERKLLMEENALLFERPRVCSQCHQFFRFLCPEDELRALDAVVAATRASVEARAGAEVAC
jgi:hypothetical protein